MDFYAIKINDSYHPRLYHSWYDAVSDIGNAVRRFIKVSEEDVCLLHYGVVTVELKEKHDEEETHGRNKGQKPEA